MPGSLLIDDMRDPAMFGCTEVARTSDAALAALKKVHWDRVYFDNDLGPKSEKEGWEIVAWMMRGGVPEELWPEELAVVSSNPAARANIESKFRSMGYEPAGREDGEMIWKRIPSKKTDKDFNEKARDLVGRGIALSLGEARRRVSQGLYDKLIERHTGIGGTGLKVAALSQWTKEDLRSDQLGIGVVIRDKEGRILMQDHKKLGMWTIPVGKVDPGSTPEETVRKEVLEETGLNVLSMRKLGSKTEHYRREGHDVTMEHIIFEATSYSGVPENKEPHKHSSMRFVSEDEIRSIGPISDCTKLALSKMGEGRETSEMAPSPTTPSLEPSALKVASLYMLREAYNDATAAYGSPTTAQPQYQERMTLQREAPGLLQAADEIKANRGDMLLRSLKGHNGPQVGQQLYDLAEAVAWGRGPGASAPNQWNSLRQKARAQVGRQTPATTVMQPIRQPQQGRIDTGQGFFLEPVAPRTPAPAISRYASSLSVVSLFLARTSE